MAEKTPPKKPGKPQASPEDLEKTVLDIDIRKLDAGLDETVMVRAPAEEDSDLYDLEPFESEERTGEHQTPEPVEEPPVADSPKAESLMELPPVIEEPPPVPSIPPPVLPLESSYQVIRHPRSWGFTLLVFGVLLLLAEALVESFQRGAALRIPGLLVTVAGGLIAASVWIRRWEAKQGFLWLMALGFGWVTYSGYFFLTSDPQSLHFFTLSLAAVVGPVLCLVSLVLALFLLREKKIPRIFKIMACIAALWVWTGYGFSAMQGLNLEAGLWGPAFLHRLPILVRPTVSMLAFAFPLFTVCVLSAALLTRGFRRRFLSGVGLPLLLLSVMGALLGARLLMRQGVQVPLWGRLVQEDYFGMTFIDPASSALRLEIQRGRPSSAGRGLPLQVFVSSPVDKNSGRQSYLMVRNSEGRSFAANLNPFLSLSRGDRKLTGVQSVLERTRLGTARELALVLNFSVAPDSTSQALVVSAVLSLADLLQPRDKLFLISASGVQTLTEKNRGQWKGWAAKALAGPPAQWPDLYATASKSFSSSPGIRQLLFLSDTASLPVLELRQSSTAEAAKAQRAVSFINVGTASANDAGVYRAASPSALSFALLSAAAESFGDFSLKLPNFAALPKVSFARDASGQVMLAQGKLDFRILAQDPSSIRSVQLKIDDEKPLDLSAKVLEQQVDLAKYKIKPGPHQFSILLTTQSGDVVSESFQAKYSVRQPLQFVKPLDRDTIAGSFNILFSPGRAPGQEVRSVELTVDGNKMGVATTDPYLVPFDASTLSEGEHTFQAVQTYSDGNTESAQIVVNVNAKAPQLKIVRPTLGEYLSNLAELEAEVGGGLFQQVQKVEFLVDGEWVGESLQAPFRFLWSNTSYPTGKYFIQARAHLSSQATVTDAVQVQLGEGQLVVQADPNLSALGMMFPENVEVLLDRSGAMSQAAGSAIKSDLAQFALLELASIAPKGVKLNVRTFGGGSETEQANCRDSVLLTNPLQQLDPRKPRGVAPLAYVLEQLSKDLKKTSGSRVGLLMTSGWDKCGEDPIAVAERLVKQGEKLRLHIIYFGDVDPGTESLLKRLAEVMGGRVYAVRDQVEVQKALQDAIQVSFSIFDYRNTPVVEQALSKTPFSLRAGEYRLEIDTIPPLKQDNLLVTTGAKRVFTVFHVEGKYGIQEE